MALCRKSLHRFWNWVINCPYQFRRYIKAQVSIGPELSILIIQIGAVLFLALPKVIDSGLLSFSSAATGIFLQYLAIKKAKQSSQHESFLKNRLSDSFKDRLETNEDEAAEFFKKELTKCLYHIMEQLGFHHSSSHRIRLFVPIDATSEQRKFNLIAFHADNSDLSHCRTDYYPDEGVLGYAFRNGSCDISNLTDPKQNEKAWKDEQIKNCHLSTEGSVNLIKFKASSYYAFAIRDTNKKVKSGIIVIESNKSYTILPTLVNNIVNKYSWYLGACLEEFIKYAPNPNLVKEKGF